MIDDLLPEPKENFSPLRSASWLRRVGPAGFLLFLGWVIYLANTGQSEVFPLSLAVFPHTDKVGHVVLYGLLAALLGYGSRFRTVEFHSWHWDRGAFIATVFACLEEVSQFLSPHRTPDPFDLLCGFLGIWATRRLFGAISPQESKAKRAANLD